MHDRKWMRVSLSCFMSHGFYCVCVVIPEVLVLTKERVIHVYDTSTMLLFREVRITTTMTRKKKCIFLRHQRRLTHITPRKGKVIDLITWQGKWFSLCVLFLVLPSFHYDVSLSLSLVCVCVCIFSLLVFALRTSLSFHHFCFFSFLFFSRLPWHSDSVALLLYFGGDKKAIKIMLRDVVTPERSKCNYEVITYESCWRI